jgi:hypothetical protein
MKRQAIFLIGLGLCSFSISFAGINDGLIAYYPFEGNSLDASGNGWHGTNMGSVQYLAGKRGFAAWFDGRSCIRLPQARLLDGASNATISAWIFFSGTTAGQVIGAGDSRGGRDPVSTRINPSAAEDAHFTQVVGGDQTELGFENGDTIPGLSVGAWHLFTLQLQRQSAQSAFRCYVDTNLVKEATNSSFSHIAYDPDMPALIGAIDASGPGQYWNGGIDELRVYDRKLSEDEIADLFALRDPYGGPLLRIGVTQVSVCWYVRSNVTYQLQYRTDLTSNLWLNLGDPIQGNETEICITDAVTTPRRLYRVTAIP